jgi:hypothetical protein
VYLAVGNPNQVQQLLPQTQIQLLGDPQKLNPYSYAEDNPITGEETTPEEAQQLIGNLPEDTEGL